MQNKTIKLLYICKLGTESPWNTRLFILIQKLQGEKAKMVAEW